MKLQELKFLMARIDACRFCSDYICGRHQDALRFLQRGSWLQRQFTSNDKLLFLYKDDDPLVVLWKRVDSRYQWDFIHTHVCYSYRTKNYPHSIESTGDLLLEIALESHWVFEDDLKKLIPLPFAKISVSGYRDPHADYWEVVELGGWDWGDEAEFRQGLLTFIEDWTETLTLPEVGEVRVFVRELYEPVEGVVARGFFMHIPGTDIINILSLS